MKKSEFKEGDVVEITNIGKADCETQNWMAGEKLSIGDKLTVKKNDTSSWLKFKEIGYSHPPEKFRLVSAEAVEIEVDWF